MEENSTNIKERVLQIPDYKGISKEKFFEIIGSSYGNFKGKSKNTSLSSDVLVEISTNFPEINIMWILTGEGPMLKKETTYDVSDKENLKTVEEKQVELEKNIDYKEKYITVLEKYNQLLEEIAEIKANAVSTAKNTSAGKKSA